MAGRLGLRFGEGFASLLPAAIALVASRLALYLVSAILLAGCAQEESTTPIDTSVDVTTELTQAIDFTLPDLAGRPHTLVEYLERGPVMLLFFATWCPYCQREIPALKEVYREYGEQGLQLVAINTGLADSEENARVYALKHRLPYPVLYDADADVSARYKVQAVPQIHLIRQNGQIVATARRVPYEEIPKLMEANHQKTPIVSGNAGS